MPNFPSSGQLQRPLTMGCSPSNLTCGHLGSSWQRSSPTAGSLIQVQNSLPGHRIPYPGTGPLIQIQDPLSKYRILIQVQNSLSGYRIPYLGTGFLIQVQNPLSRYRIPYLGTGFLIWIQDSLSRYRIPYLGTQSLIQVHNPLSRCRVFRMYIQAFLLGVQDKRPGTSKDPVLLQAWRHWLKCAQTHTQLSLPATEFFV